MLCLGFPRGPLSDGERTLGLLGLFRKRHRHPPHPTNAPKILRIETEVEYALMLSWIVGSILTEERIILDRRYEVLIVGEERFCSGQGGKVGGGRFLW